MKRALIGVLAAAIVLSAGMVTAFGVEPANGCYFVDADGDGICDNRGSCGWGGGQGAGCGMGFVDADGDGICDNYTAGQCRGNGRGSGQGGAFRGGRGCGRWAQVQ